MTDETSKIQEGYQELESLTLSLLCKLLRDALESGETTTASLLGTAVSMLRAGGVQQNSTQALRESQSTSASWFNDLPQEAKEKLLEGPAGTYVERVISDDQEE